MHGYFWTNTIWYLILLSLTLIMYTIALIKSDNRRFLLSFMFAVVGLFYLFEYVLVVILDAYQYYPMIRPDDAFQDLVLGNIISQTSIMAVAILIIALRLRPVWYFVFAIFYFFVEVLFVRLGIFKEHWYKAIFTPMILLPLLWAIRQWYTWAEKSQSKTNETISMFLGTLSLSYHCVYLPLKLLKIHLFTGGFSPDVSRDHTTTLFPYSIVFIGLLVAIFRLQSRWYWKAPLLAGLYLLQYISYKAGLMAIRDGWFVWVTLLEIFVPLLWVSLIHWLIHSRRPSADGLPAE